MANKEVPNGAKMKNDYEKIQPLKHKNILLCVSGSIAAYKALEILSRLKKLGANVAVVLSEEAKRFISPLSFEAISHIEVLHKDTESWADYNLRESLDFKSLDSSLPPSSCADLSADFIDDSCADSFNNSSISKSSTADFARPYPKSHIAYSKWAHIILLAPATANTIAKLAYGIADNLIVQTLLATDSKRTQILLAPAMNTQMFLSPQVQSALDRLQNYGYEIIPPKEALLACEQYGVGALAEVEEIIFRTLRASYVRDFAPMLKDSSDFVDSKQDKLSQSDFAQSDFGQGDFRRSGFYQSDFWQNDFWMDREVIITGGGAISPIDAVRSISNHSSGKQAIALAKAAYTLGAKVTLISSKIDSFLPSQIKCILAQSNDDYKEAIESKLRDFGAFEGCADVGSFDNGVKSKSAKEAKITKDKTHRKKPVLFMAAALCDYALKSPKTYKIKKSTSPNLTLELQSCQDVLASIDSEKIYKVGFKAESIENITQENEKNAPKNTLKDALKNAKKMLLSTSEGGKGCYCVCLNAISKNSTPFGAEDNSFYLLDSRALRDESCDEKHIAFLPPQSKLALSYQILDFIQSSLQDLDPAKGKIYQSTKSSSAKNK